MLLSHPGRALKTLDLTATAIQEMQGTMEKARNVVVCNFGPWLRAVQTNIKDRMREDGKVEVR